MQTGKQSLREKKKKEKLMRRTQNFRQSQRIFFSNETTFNINIKVDPKFLQLLKE